MHISIISSYKDHHVITRAVFVFHPQHGFYSMLAHLSLQYSTPVQTDQTPGYRSSTLYNSCKCDLPIRVID